MNSEVGRKEDTLLSWHLHFTGVSLTKAFKEATQSEVPHGTRNEEQRWQTTVNQRTKTQNPDRIL